MIASGVATAVAAIGASFLGVYGTVIGTALMSVISTAGAAVCKHYLDQGRDQIRDMSHVQDSARRRAAAEDAGEEATSADPTRTVVWPAGADPGRTMVRPPGGDPNATRLDGGLGDPNATRSDASAASGAPSGGAGDPNATRLDPSVTVAGALAAEAGEDARRRVARRAALDDTLAWAKRNWVKLAASSAAVFAVVLGGITIYEATTGGPIGGSGGGLTVTHVLGGDGSGDGSGDPAEQGPAETPTVDGTAPAGTPEESPTGEAPTGNPDEPGDGSGTAPTDGSTSGPSGGEPTGGATDEPTAPPTSSAPETPGTPAPTGTSGGGQEQENGTDAQRGTDAGTGN